MDNQTSRTQTRGVPTYRISVTAQLTPMSAVDAARLRVTTGASVKVLAVDIVRLDVTSQGPDAACAADRALAAISAALGPGVGFARPAVWVARRTGPRRLLGVTTGRWSGGGNDDDGLGGVREPRRPAPSAGSAAAALDPPAA